MERLGLQKPIAASTRRVLIFLNHSCRLRVRSINQRSILVFTLRFEEQVRPH